MHLLDESVGKLAGDVLGGAALLVGALDDLVVHVGQVLGEGDLVALVHEVTADDVEGQERATVADVNLVIDGGAADVHANLAGLDGRKLDLLVKLGVIDEHWLLLVLKLALQLGDSPLEALHLRGEVVDRAIDGIGKVLAVLYVLAFTDNLVNCRLVRH